MATSIELPKIITHKNIEPVLKKLGTEPYFQIGSKVSYRPDDWFWQSVTLEVCTGELCKDGLTTIALVGHNQYTTVGLSGKEGFQAQGLEGKVQIQKPLFNALMNMRDLIPIHRGRIVRLGN